MKKKPSGVREPIKRSPLRARLGMWYYGGMRRLLWVVKRKTFARQKQPPFGIIQFSHKTPLLRKLRDVDMQYQYNKIVNLKIAVKELNGIVIRPGEVFSYWYLIGATTRKKGYIEGMVLKNGTFGYGVGGGLCQMSNLIYWMTLHTPLTVIERHRHGYDVFPDSKRTQPFGSGATCYYPHGDLMIRNDTDMDFQLCIRVGDEFLEGEWRAEGEPQFSYEIVERDHEVKSEYWGGYSRHNKLFRRVYDKNGTFIREEFVVQNDAIMMYPPFLSDSYKE